MFQHTATRRWLRAFGLSSQAIFSFNTQPPEGGCASVFRSIAVWNGFNTQPPEGGCTAWRTPDCNVCQFQHTATRRWLPHFLIFMDDSEGFNTQPPEGGCPRYR